MPWLTGCWTPSRWLPEEATLHMEFMLGLHNLFRWLVLLAGIYAIFAMVRGLAGSARFTDGDRRAGLIYTTVLDVQFVIGLIVYFISPLVRGAMQNMADAMSVPEVRFFAAEHAIYMLVALVLAHIGYSRTKKAGTDRGRFSAGAIFYTLSLVVVLAGIPWMRSLMPWG